MTDPTTKDPLKHLPDEARIWIYAADRDLNDLEEKRIVEILQDFCDAWRSHGRPVESAADVMEGRFAVIAGRIPGGNISGCGIDASVHALDRASAELGIEWLPALLVHFRDSNGYVHSVSRSEFRGLAEAGTIDAQTPVFDLSIETLGELRRGMFERPAHSTWHGRTFHLLQQTR